MAHPDCASAVEHFETARHIASRPRAMAQELGLGITDTIELGKLHAELCGLALALEE